MTESTLTATYQEVLQTVGNFLGYGRNYDNWSDKQKGDVFEALRHGLRIFSTPPVLEGERMAHQWRFMRPWTTLNTVSGTTDYVMPDHHGGVIGSMVISDSSFGPTHVKKTGASEILRMRSSRSSRTGKPEFYSTSPLPPKNPDPVTALTGLSWSGAREAISLFPEPDAVYTLQYQFTLIPNLLITDSPYQAGGAMHSATAIQACLAAAELRFRGERGAQYAEFLDRLRASVSYDREQYAPDTLGSNLDGSVSDYPASPYRTEGVYVTYNNQTIVE